MGQVTRIAVLALAGLAIAESASAATAVTDITGGSVGTSSHTRGFSFTMASPFEVTALGYYDFDGDGLDVSHQVGIFDAGGNLLVSGTVAAGTVDPLTGGFRYTSLLTGTTSLLAGQYFVGGKSEETDFNLRLASSATFGPSLTYGESTRNGSTSGFSAPTTSTPGLDIGYFGPNFTYSLTSAVPEPATWAMMIGGFGIVGGAMRSARRNSKATLAAA